MKTIKSLKRIIVMADKEWIQIRRDARSLAISIVIPVLLVLLFGYALVLDVNHVSTAIYDQDKSGLSRSLLEKFSHTEYISIHGHVRDYREIDDLLNSGAISLAIVIPPGLEQRYKSGKEASIQLLVDGSNSTTATVSMGYVKMITYNFNREKSGNELQRAGINLLKEPIDVRSRIWYNPDLKSKNFIIPGVIVIMLAIVSSLITSLTISREWERGTMETLITTPVRGVEIILGKLVPYLFLGVFDVILALCIGYFVFNIPIRGNFWELCLISMLFLIGTSSLGITVSSATRIQVLSVQTAVLLTYMPSLILSGFIFPIENMPGVIQGLTYLIPARYLITVVKGIALKGVGFSMLWTQIIFLSVFAFFTVVMGIKKFSVVLPGD